MNSNPKGIITLLAQIREKANAFIIRELEVRNIKGILPAHGTILSIMLNTSEPMTISTLVQKVERAKSTVTVMVNKLVKEDYLKKVNCDRDSRCIYIHATPKLLAIKKDFNQIAGDLISKTYGDMTDAEIKTVLNLLIKINQNMDG